jgi:peptide/nickel transport system substrate-binding protein
MKKLRWQLIIIFLTGLVVGILLLGEQPVATVTQAPQPVKGGIYTEALVGSLQRLNPLLDVYNPVDRDVDRLIFSGLFSFDSRGLAQVDLAQDYGISQDGTIYNITLKTDVRWQDGEPFTSADVLFTIDLMRSGEGVVPDDLRSFWNTVDVKALSPDQLQFKLPEAYSPFLDYLSFGILPEHLLKGIAFKDLVNSPFNLQPVGTGPYKFERLMVEDNEITGVALKVNDKYYKKAAFIDQFIFRYYPDGPTALKAYQDGAVQGIGQVSSDILPEVLAQKDLNVYTGREPDASMVLFNIKNPQTPFFEDAKVRRALAMGINRQWIVDRILQGQAILATGPIFPGTWAYYDGVESFSFDTDQAINLLKDAGYAVPAEGDTTRQKDGKPLAFELIYPDDEQHAAIAEAIKRDWTLLNIQVTLTPRPYDQLIKEDLGNRQYQAALVDLNLSRSPDPDPYPFWDQAQATGGQNYSQWDNRNASEYIEQARVNPKLSDRQKLYRNFQVVFNQDLPAIPLFYPVYTYAVDRQVQGVQIGPLYDTSDRFMTVTQWYLRAARPTSNANPSGSTVDPKLQSTPTK